MLELHVAERELYDESSETFVTVPPCGVRLEHSLLSVSKWESRTKKAFLSDAEKTNDEIIFYLSCMSENNISLDLALSLFLEHGNEIQRYISDEMTATTFTTIGGHKGVSEFITSELIYHWMVTLNIPFECETWHLNRLLTLIRVCGEKNKPSDKKIPKNELRNKYAQLNAERRQKYGTAG